jgi:hypothetical protein
MYRFRSMLPRLLFLVASVCAAAGVRSPGFADATVAAATRAFMFPSSMANGVSGDLVPPAGSTSKLSFAVGKVAIGQLPVPLVDRAGRRGRASTRLQFVRPADAGPHARLFLRGVVDASGATVSNGGNQLVIDAAISPSAAALEPPPFVFQFSINNGMAFLDTPLPIQDQPDGSTHVQILGVSVVDPDGQPFGVLGFELPPQRPMPTAPTPTPGGTPAPQGQCIVGPDCAGASFPASQDKCCRFLGRPNHRFALTTSWCPADQIDRATGRCLAAACVNCVPPPPLGGCAGRSICGGQCSVSCPDGTVHSGKCLQGKACDCSADCAAAATPTPVPCGDPASCTGPCTINCPDGRTVAGECASSQEGACQCSATCVTPTPCAIGQCFDTITLRCTGHPCSPELHCPLPNQLCDASGSRCPCGPPLSSVPHGRICC